MICRWSCGIVGERRETEGRFVHEHGPQPGHEAAGDGEHPLLAARQRSGPLAPSLLESGKEGEVVREVALERIARSAVGAEEQVLLHAHPTEHLTPLGHERDTAADQVLGLDARDVPILKRDDAASRGQQPRYGLHEGGLPGAVGPMRLRMAPGWISIVRSSRATRPPNALLTPATSTSAPPPSRIPRSAIRRLQFLDVRRGQAVRVAHPLPAAPLDKAGDPLGNETA